MLAYDSVQQSVCIYALYTPELTLLVQDPIILLDRDYASSCVVSSAEISSTSIITDVGLSVEV